MYRFDIKYRASMFSSCLEGPKIWGKGRMQVSAWGTGFRSRAPLVSQMQLPTDHRATSHFPTLWVKRHL